MAKVNSREIVKTNLYWSILRTDPAKVNICENNIRCRIAVQKFYAIYMDRNIRLTRSVHYEPFITKRYISVGEVEKEY